MYRILLITLLITSCSYKPIYDSRGNKGKEVSFRYIDDKHSCEQLAKENTNSFVEGSKVVYNWYVRPSLLWLPDKLEYNYNNFIDQCLTNRGHSIIRRN